MQKSTTILNEKLRTAILAQDAKGAECVAKDIIAAGADAAEVINLVVKPIADEVGEKFKTGEFFLPQLMLAGQALEKAMNVFVEVMPGGQDEAKQSVVIGTVKGDIHTIGKNVVAMMLRTNGFKVYDIGIDVDATTFVKEAVAHNVDIIAVSSLLTTTLPYQRDVIEELEAQGLRDGFKVIIGGGPATQAWADEIGADGYGKDAPQGVAVARSLVGRGHS